MAVVKYNPDGSLDDAFGEKGIANIIFESSTYRSSVANSLLVQQDGKLLLGGSVFANDGGTGANFALARLNSNGSIDSSFGINGEQITDFGEQETANTVALQKDEKIILIGNTFSVSQGTGGITLLRYNNDAALLLQFTYFNATPTTNGGIAINWQTVQENNNDFFAVERSGDSRFRGNDENGGGNDNQFEITRINSKGNSSQVQTYSFTDNAPLQGTNFYRLKQVDKDSKFSYSQIVSATFENGLTVVLYPNPVKDVLNIKGLDADNNYQLKINNAKGNVVASTQINNTSTYKWNLQSLSKGVYYLNIISNNKTTTVKFVKE